MNVEHLQDRIYWGLNRAANILGQSTDAYRPTGPADPLERSNRYLQLKAAFSRSDGSFTKAVGYDSPCWQGYFDASYTLVGDYLVQGGNIWFIIAQQSLLPLLCVKTNRVLSITRSAPPDTGQAYGSGSSFPREDILTNWPASLLGIGGREKSPAQLPGDIALETWTALLPSVNDRTILVSDVVTDEYGTKGVVAGAELTELGWRLNVRRIST